MIIRSTLPSVCLTGAVLVALPALVLSSAAFADSPMKRVERMKDHVDARSLENAMGLNPRGITIPITLEQAGQNQELTQIYAVTDTPHIIYMNRHGGTFQGGFDDSADNHSSIVNGQSATLSGFSGNDSDWAQVLSCVQDQFSPFNVIVTDQEPLEGDYVESVVGGSPDQLGLPWGVGGVAPFDPYGCTSIERGVVYTFADIYGNDNRAICETAAQEIAHAYSLDHELLCTDPMTYLDGCGAKTFQNEFASCGEYEERECSCGRPSQNSVQLLSERLGTSDGSPPPATPVDSEDPVVTLISPLDGDILLSGSTVQIEAEATDDVGLVQVSLDWDYNDISVSCPGEGRGWACERNGTHYTWSIQVSEGSRTFRVRARDVAGNIVTSSDATIWLSPDNTPPPQDLSPPEVFVVSPQNAAVLGSQGEIVVQAVATDDVGVAQVGLNWVYSSQTFGCPMQSQSVNCEVNGATYTWTIQVGDGSRTFSVTARDLLGKETTTSDRTISLSNNPPAAPADDDFEGNTTFDLAGSVSCGAGLNLTSVPGNDDWFFVDAPVGSPVRVTTRGGDNININVATGPSKNDGLVSADGDGSPAVTFEVPDGQVAVRIRTSGDGGNYRLVVSCLPADYLNPPTPVMPQSASACSHLDSAPVSSNASHLAGVLALFGLIGLSRRRRVSPTRPAAR